MKDEPTEPRKKGHRRIWNHILEKFLFSPHEIATLGAPHRRTIYVASLEAHIDRLHSQLLEIGFYPIPVDALAPYKGLNCKTAKGMVAGLQHDICQVRLQLLEIERALNRANQIASVRAHHDNIVSEFPVQNSARHHPYRSDRRQNHRSPSLSPVSPHPSSVAERMILSRKLSLDSSMAQMSVHSHQSRFPKKQPLAHLSTSHLPLDPSHHTSLPHNTPFSSSPLDSPIDNFNISVNQSTHLDN